MKQLFKFICIVLFSILMLTYCSILESVEEKRKHDIYNFKQEIVPMKFIITKKTDYLSFSCAFYDLNKNKISDDKLISIKGNELFLECIVTELNGYAKAVFPYRVYSNIVPPSQGVIIVNDYNKNDFPAIFAGVKSRQEKLLKKIYKDICKSNFKSKWYYSVVHKPAELKPKKEKLVVRVKGGIEILSEE